MKRRARSNGFRAIGSSYIGWNASSYKQMHLKPRKPIKDVVIIRDVAPGELSHTEQALIKLGLRPKKEG